MGKDVSRLEGGRLPAAVYSLETAGSVLDVAREMGDALPVWGSVLARTQTEGRGQLRRQWRSPPGNIYAALRLPVEPPFTESAASPALGGLLASVARHAGLDFWVKWPNDMVLLQGGQPRKVGGVLLEERAGRVCAGIGINLAWAPPDAELRRDHAIPATHLHNHIPFPAEWGGDMAEPPLSLAERAWCWLVSGIHFWYANKLRTSCSLLAAAEACLLWRETAVILSDGNSHMRGILRGLGPSGGVLLAMQGRVDEFLSGSLSGAVGDSDVP